MIISALAIIFIASIIVWPYQYRNFKLTSEIAPALRVFYYNQSHHTSDPVKNCWYDSGDYIVFSFRNLESLYYLSLAYKYSTNSEVKQDLLRTINSQLPCTDKMLSDGWKQFRDQDSHGSNLPPLLHQLFYPQNFYRLQTDEGKELFALRALVAQNLGDSQSMNFYRTKSAQTKLKTTSENCCEEGPLVMSDQDFTELLALNGLAIPEKQLNGSGWAISFENIRLIQEKKYDKIKKLLLAVQQKWTDQALQFDYIGGNYDIAGTIAIEKLYEKETNDYSFRPLSDSLYDYLHAKNAYHIDFTEYEKTHHPCGQWWATCNLHETLINGIDEELSFDPERRDIWRMTEIQLVGQARYILAMVLYNDY